MPPAYGDDLEYYYSQNAMQAYDYDESVAPLPPKQISQWESDSRVVQSRMDLSGGASGGGLLKDLFKPFDNDPTWYWTADAVSASPNIVWWSSEY